MKVFLTSEKAGGFYQKGSVLTFSGEGAVIHASPFTYLRDIQRGARKLAVFGADSAELTGDEWSTEAELAFTQGFRNEKRTESITYAFRNDELENELAAADFVRKAVNTSPSEIYPESLSAMSADFISGRLGKSATVSLMRRPELEKAGCAGLLAAGAGSAREPVLFSADFNPSGNPDEPVTACLVGKGITFDTGGYSMKPSNYMYSMKSDMTGAAYCAAALVLAASRGLRKRVRIFECLAENMVSGSACRPGDVITYRNGKSVEIVNTDAEGRLVLADGLISAAECHPLHILDCATLTGSAKAALGRDYNAVLSRDLLESLSFCTMAAAENEYAWPLPLAPFHSDMIKSDVADIANSSQGSDIPGASTAAAFLSEFVPEGTDWIHLDLSASYTKSANGMWATGAKCHGIRSIAHWLMTL